MTTSTSPRGMGASSSGAASLGHSRNTPSPKHRTLKRDRATMKVLEVVRRGGSTEGSASSVEAPVGASEGDACEAAEGRGCQVFELELDVELPDPG